MRSHLWFLTAVHALRALGGLALAFVFFYYSVHVNVPSDLDDLSLSRYHQVQPGDLEAFYSIAMVPQAPDVNKMPPYSLRQQVLFLTHWTRQAGQCKICAEQRR